MFRLIKNMTFIFVLIFMFNIDSIALAEDDKYIAEYDDEVINISCSVNSKYAGLPASAMLKSNTENEVIPLYVNDTIIKQDGTFNLSFSYEIDNISNYFIRLNIASEYTKDVPLSEKQFVEEIFDISKVQYYNNDEWLDLDFNAYEGFIGKSAELSVVIPKAYEKKSVVIFVTKDSEERLTACYFANRSGNRFCSTIDIPENGTVEAYCWKSLTNPMSYCDKVILPDGIMQTFKLSENPAPIVENPGKGWVRYRSDYAETVDTLQYASVGYNRFNWNQVEPSEGVYNWSVIDSFINKWDSLGKKAAFGIAMASSTNSSSYLTPKWVFDAGAKYTMNGTQYVPVWDDEVYLEKLDNFTEAFARKYDGDRRIAFIDIRSYGNFGEGHTTGLSGSALLSAEKEKLHIDIATKHFKKTQLMICTANTADQGIKTKYATNNGVGLRTDSILDGNYSEVHRLDDAYGKEPTIFEFVTSYTSMKSAADAYGSASNDNAHWNEDRYLMSFFAGKPSYMDLGQYNNDATNFIEDNRELIELLSNKMGYHFVLNSIEIPKKIAQGTTFNFNSQWANKGVAPLYEDCYPALAVLDSNNNVIAKCWLDSLKPNSWQPNTEIFENAKACFSNIRGESIKLAIGLFINKNNITPKYKIGNYNATDNKWYIIANGVKSGDAYELSAVSQGQAIINTKLDDFVASKISPFVDDSNTANIISDYSLEKSACNWGAVKNLSVVKKSSNDPHTGSYCGQITNRSDMWSGAQIDITDRLKQNGAGTYRFEGWFRTPSSRNITVYPFRINSVTEYSFTANVGTSWTKVSKDIEITDEQIAKLTHAVTLILGDNRGSIYNKNDIFFDDISLTKIN